MNREYVLEAVYESGGPNIFVDTCTDKDLIDLLICCMSLTTIIEVWVYSSKDVQTRRVVLHMSKQQQHIKKIKWKKMM